MIDPLDRVRGREDGTGADVSKVEMVSHTCSAACALAFAWVCACVLPSSGGFVGALDCGGWEEPG